MAKSSASTGDAYLILNASGTGAGRQSKIFFGDSADLDVGAIDYLHDSDSMQIRTAATTAITIDSDQNSTFAGNVGIGIDTPTLVAGKILHIHGTAAGVHLTDTASGTTSGDGGYVAFDNPNLYIQNKEAGSMFFETSGTTALTIDSDGDATFAGNVLIGTNINSSIGLQVNQSLGSGNAIGFFRNSASSDGNGLVVDVTNTPSNYLADFRIGNSSKVRIDTEGNLSIGQSSENNISNTTGETWIGSNGLRYNSGSDTFARSSATAQAAMMVLTTTADVEFYAQPSTSQAGTYALTPKMVIKGASGNVGISTDSPDSKLQVVGAGQDQIRFGTSTSIYTDLWMGTGYSVIDSIGGSEGGFDFRDDGTSRMRLKMPGSTIQDVTLQLKTTGASDNAGIMFINSGNTSSFNDIAGIASFVESGSAKGNLQFWTRNSDGDNTDVATRMTIDSSGFTTITHSGAGASLTLGQSGNISINENIGYLNFYSNDSSTTSTGGVGGIGVYGETAFSTSYTPTYMSFFTHDTTANDGTVQGNVTERMRITSGGYFKASNTGTYVNTAQSYHELNQTTGGEWSTIIHNDTSAPYGLYIKYSSVAPNSGGSEFIYCADSSAQRFYVTSAGAVYGNGTYGTVSDRKLKENIVDATPKLDDINKLKVRNFNFKDNPEEKHIGFIAQELEKVFPKVVETKQDKDEDNNLIEDSYTKTIKTSILIPMLVKSIQELKAEIDDLKNKCNCK